MADHDLDELVRQLDPVSGDSFDAIATTDGAARLLKQIIAGETFDTEERPAQRLRRPVSALIAVGAATLAVILILTFSPFAGQTAAAAVNSAADKTAALTAGRLVVTVELTTLPAHDPTPSGSTLRFDASYDGGDYHLTSDVSALAPTAFSEDLVTSHIRVGDREFFRSGPAGWSETTGGWSPANDAGVGTAVDDLAKSGDQLALLLRQAENLSRSGDVDGADRYEGTLRDEVLKASAADALPIGVSVLRDQPLPEVLGIEVVVRGGLLESVAVRAEGLVDGYGYEDVTVRSVFHYAEPLTAPVAPDVLIPLIDADVLVQTLIPDGLIRVRGQVAGAPVQQPDGTISLVVQGAEPIAVSYEGPPPFGSLTSGAEVIVLGESQGATFAARQIIIRSTF